MAGSRCCFGTGWATDPPQTWWILHSYTSSCCASSGRISQADQVPLPSKTQQVNFSTTLASYSNSEDEDQHALDVMPFSTPRNATLLPHPPTTPRNSVTPRRSMRLHNLSASVPIYNQSSITPTVILWTTLPCPPVFPPSQLFLNSLYHPQ